MMTETSKLSDFDYGLPKALIAAHPLPERSSSRLMTIDRVSGRISHRVFRDLETLFRPGDLVVLNNTKVLPARLFGTRETGGKVEALLLQETAKDKWTVLLRPGGRVRRGTSLVFGENGVRVKATVESDPLPDSGERVLKFHGGHFKEKLRAIGHMPLPPYIDRPDAAADRERYQTVFAEKEGAVAAPTAGLHFDRALLQALDRKGVEIVRVTLHVSYGTFQPIGVEDLARHEMFEERYRIEEDAAARIRQAKRDAKRVIACGTTVVRTLESAADDQGGLLAGERTTRLFIRPPYRFRIVDGLITNFHLPKSSLFILVAAFYNRNGLLKAYAEAIRERYRFYSYGDAMVIL